MAPPKANRSPSLERGRTFLLHAMTDCRIAAHAHQNMLPNECMAIGVQPFN